ncbi:hypothetical protein GCM10009678_65100 [Actinomadura kijaniata]|uniref:Uncharacterized protein n=1 Tax=Actinomadura namibiensis TaxID=182080 RepID=A0A7W3LY20_ACTNM|nr:hypothetical protein [Actinomadura namibiensis]MBA8956408.1 hypothetical protein [Actinomadura namibiensis]
MAEARRRAGMESPAERGHRLAATGALSRAAAELRAAYDDGSASVASFGLAVYRGDLARAEQVMAGLGGDLVRSWAAEVAVDLAFQHARTGDAGTAGRPLDLLEAADLSARALRYALENGSARPPELATEIGARLLGSLVDPAPGGQVETIVEAARHRLPERAALACRLQIACERDFGRPGEAARWSARPAEIGGAPPG